MVKSNEKFINKEYETLTNKEEIKKVLLFKVRNSTITLSFPIIIELY